MTGCWKLAYVSIGILCKGCAEIVVGVLAMQIIGVLCVYVDLNCYGFE